jgi:hypothetical protein
MEHISDIYMQYFNAFASKEKHKRQGEGRVVFFVGSRQDFSVAVAMPPSESRDGCTFLGFRLISRHPKTWKLN